LGKTSVIGREVDSSNTRRAFFNRLQTEFSLIVQTILNIWSMELLVYLCFDIM